MSSLTEIEKRYFEELFGMRSGYVLDFSDTTFSEFFRSTVRVDIDDPKYGGTSKGKRLRSFWEQETDALVGKVLGEMLKVWFTKTGPLPVTTTAILKLRKPLLGLQVSLPGPRCCRGPNAPLQASANIQVGSLLSDAPVYFFHGAPNHALEEDREDG